MRILLLSYEYPPIGGGGGVGASQYAEAWAANGHEVAVLTSRAPGLAARETVNNVDVLRVQTIGRKNRSTASFLSMLCYNVTALVYVLLHRRRLGQFDVMNTHFSIPTGPVAWAAAKILQIPNVLTIIGGDIYDPSKKSSPHRHAALRWVNRWIIGAADRVIAISSDTKQRAERYYGITRPIEVINYGFQPRENVGVTEELPIQFNSEAFYLIAIGRLVARKSFDVLLRALQELPGDVELVLVGDGPLEGPLRQLAAKLQITNRLHMVGYQTPNQIDQLLRKCDCFVLSSSHEGLGIVVQEAMDAGLPVVATNNGGQVDLIQHEHNGHLVEINNPEALAAAIRTLYWDRELARQMGDNNRHDIQRLDMRHNNRLYLEVFESASGIPSNVNQETDATQPIQV